MTTSEKQLTITRIYLNLRNNGMTYDEALNDIAKNLGVSRAAVVWAITDLAL